MKNLEQPEEVIECCSPPCMLHELNAGPALFPQTLSMPSDEQDWASVRLWRKAKRQVLVERRLAVSVTDRTAHSIQVTATLAEMLDSARDKLLGFYWPFKGEYDPRSLVRSLHGKGVRLALPIVTAKAKPLVFREWSPGQKMSHGIWNIPIPADGGPVFPDVLLVPLVGFDKLGFRLGYGGGYFDRTLATAVPRPRAIGVGFARLEVATIHPQPHDIAMDCIVTEAGVLNVQGRRSCTAGPAASSLRRL